jgi:uncharacterized phage-like protein YoqJ
LAVHLDPNKACAFTGRRSSSLPWKYDESHPLCLAFLPVLRQSVLNACRAGHCVFLSGMALGIDLLACDVVTELRDGGVCPGVSLVGVVPGAGQADRWPEAEQERYRRALSRCDGVVTLEASGRLTPGHYIVRNRYLVDHSARLIAVWDGIPSGGTYHTIRYARSKGHVIDILRTE